jgi:hypothetical protein
VKSEVGLVASAGFDEMVSGVALALGVAALAAGACEQHQSTFSRMSRANPVVQAHLRFGSGIGSSSGTEQPNKEVVDSRSQVLSVSPSNTSSISASCCP